MKQADATKSVNGAPEPVVATDPPYYDNNGYADLADFFYVLLRRSLGSTFPQLFATLLTPKSQELIASPYRHGGSKDKAQAFFEEGLEKAFGQMGQAQSAGFPITVYYAFKQVETDKVMDAGLTIAGARNVTASTGWETMLSGLIRSGFCVCGTWPMHTERDQGLKTGSNVLASSVVLVCRQRSSSAALSTRREFMAAPKNELPRALADLRHANSAPVDLSQAAIGPGMAVFTRYAKVMESDGSAMTVRTALAIINQTLDEVLADQEREFDAEMRWAVAWFEQHGVEEGPFGVAETLSKAKNTAVNGLVEAGIVSAKAGKVKLIRRNDLPEDWDPANEKRLTVWEVAQHLIRTLDQKGEQATAELLTKLGGLGEVARDLAYRLYSVCERKKWAQEALAYNSLVVAWPDILKLAVRGELGGQTQTEMFNDH